MNILGSGTLGAFDITAPSVHTTSGVLTSSASTIAGTSAHIALHTTSGVLTGSESTFAGTSSQIHTFIPSMLIHVQRIIVRH